MDSIGNRLREARESKDLSIEDASHQTRIQAIYIRGLENDDFSNFPSTTYAKSFLSLYSRFLGIDAEDALNLFAGGDEVSLSGRGYLESVTDNIEPRRPNSAYAYGSSRPSAPRARRSSENSPGLAPLFLGLVLVALVIAIPTLWILGKDADSIDEVVTKGKELTNTKFSTADPKAEIADPDTPEKEVENNTGQQVPPAPATPPETQETKPVKLQEAPGDTKMAQATPPNTERTLNHSPGVASPVVTGAKPKTAGSAAPLQAKPVVEKPVETSPKPSPSPPPETPGNANQPLRAVPLIARPLVIPAEDQPGNEEETPEPDPASVETPDEEDAGPRNDGNQFPRPLE